MGIIHKGIVKVFIDIIDNMLIPNNVFLDYNPDNRIGGS